jgi:predicted permease
MDSLLQDIRFAARQLARSPGFTAIAALTLALGIGANTALYTLAHAALQRPLPGIRGADRLLWLTPVGSRGDARNMSYPDFVDYRSGAAGPNGPFAEIASFDDMQFSLSTRGLEPERVRGSLVSGSFFSTVGASMAVGRGFLAVEDSTPGTHPVAVISYALWQRRFDGDPGVIGREILLNGAPFTVVGVTPDRFNGPDHAELRDVWVPTMMISRVYPQWPRMLEQRSTWFLRVIGRLKPGATKEGADAVVATIAKRIAATDSAGHRGITARNYEVRSGMVPGNGNDVYPVAALAAVVTGLVLLIACANVTNLLLGRAVGRRREISVRLSLGAGRTRLVRQLLTESVLLSLLATAIGAVLASWGTDFMVAQIPAPLDVSLDRSILLFTVAAAIVTGCVFGLVPALHATRGDLATAMKESLVGFDVRRSRLQRGFVVAQLSLSLVLLVTAGMFLRSLYKSAKLDFGFETTTRVLALSFDLGRQGYSPEQASRFLSTLQERVAGLPGVERLAFSDQVPLGERIVGGEIVVESKGPRDEAAFDPRSSIDSYLYTVRPGYFATLDIPLVRGRDFSADDRSGAPDVAIVSEQFARRAWPSSDAIGKRISVDGPEGPYATIIGVAREALIAGRTERARPIIYFAHLQRPRALDLTLLVRARCAEATEDRESSRCNAGRLATNVRREIASLDRNLPVYGVQTLAQYRTDRLAEARLGSGLLGAFGALALLLASVGVYAVTAFTVSQRTREIGVRVALGALQNQVVALFLREGMRVTLIGTLIGLTLALALAKTLSAVFIGLSVGDVPTIVAIVALLSAVALVACWVPARRAARVDPMLALRHE